MKRLLSITLLAALLFGGNVAKAQSPWGQGFGGTITVPVEFTALVEFSGGATFTGGTVSFTVAAQFADGSAAAPSITFTNDTDLGLFNNTNAIGFTVAGSNQFNLLAARFSGDNGSAGALLNEIASSTNPTLIPNRSDLTTGIGGDGTELNFIVDGSDPGISYPSTVFWQFNYGNNADLGLGTRDNDSFRLFFGNPNDPDAGRIAYNHNGELMGFYANNTHVLGIDNSTEADSGYVWIGALTGVNQPTNAQRESSIFGVWGTNRSDSIAVFSNDADATLDSGVVLNERGWLGVFSKDVPTPTSGMMQFSRYDIVGDIDGHLNLRSGGATRMVRVYINNATELHYQAFAGESAFNENSADIDFRVESDGDDNIINVNAGNDDVTFGHSGYNEQQTTTLGAAATTFAVTANIIQLTGDAGANTIATITAANIGIYVIQFVDALITITDTDAHTANTVDLNGAATDLTSADDLILTLMFDGTSWYEIARSQN